MVLQLAPAMVSARKTWRSNRILAGIIGFIMVGGAFATIAIWFSSRSTRGFLTSMVSFERATTNNPGAVSGTVQNQYAHSRHGVRVEIELLNSRGQPLWSTTAFTPIMEPEKTWSFRAGVIDPNVATARVVRVRELGR